MQHRPKDDKFRIRQINHPAAVEDAVKVKRLLEKAMKISANKITPANKKVFGKL
jgi:hypothetical protein